jgi:hypothetical protein
MSLSPNTLYGLRATGYGSIADFSDAGPAWAAEYKRYVCPACDSSHKQESDAEACCPRDTEVVYESEDGQRYDSASELAEAVAGSDADSACSSGCPVCAEPYTSHALAADCCLWKDIDAPTRWRIAAAVEQGTPWLDAITTHTKE